MAVEFVGGPEQAEFMARVRGLDPGQVLLVPVDASKSEAMAMVTDLRGEVVMSPFKFALTASGAKMLNDRAVSASASRSAALCRVGVETAGHYHRPLVEHLVADHVEVVELNPAAVKASRVSNYGPARRPTNETLLQSRIC